MDTSEIDRIEADLARTRERIRIRLNELRHHLTPRQMVDDAFVRFRGGQGGDFTDDVIGRVKANPVPAGIAGLAIAWLMAGKTEVASQSRHTRTSASTFSRRRTTRSTNRPSLPAQEVAS
ncbi:MULTISPECIES: DUF3618 domain-containing protein [unclassified Sphingomonas]|uniref:DUF3618 domain-containing protein n=1 Tax=unclassified Sphingomonas TaxID=196159 RepID=UPI002269997F|nr:MULTISPECIES: DUF3618 domain-containing protein [unclassified Sphingomonas]